MFETDLRKNRIRSTRKAGMRASIKSTIIKSCIFSMLAIGSSALGAQDRLFGVGVSSTAAPGGGAVVAEAPFAVSANPALMAAAPVGGFGMGLTVGQTKYGSFGTVLNDSARFRTREGRESVRSEFRLPTKSISYWNVGLSYPFRFSRNSRRKLGLGAAFSGSFNSVRKYDAGTPYSFHSLKYGASSEQLKAIMGGAVEVVRDTLYFGAALSLYVSASGNADAVIISDDPTARVRLDVGLNSHAILGSFLKLGEHRLAAVYRHKSNPKYEQRLVGRVQLTEEAETLDIPMVVEAYLYYEPTRIDLDWSFPLTGGLSGSVGVTSELWSGYVPPFATVRAPTREGEVARTKTADLRLKDTVNPRASLIYAFPQSSLRVMSGYQFRPSPVSTEDLQGRANLIDTGTHVIGVGAQAGIGRLGEMPLKLSAYGQVHLFQRRDIVKDRVSDTRDESIGFPGYKVRGRSLAAGIAIEGQF